MSLNDLSIEHIIAKRNGGDDAIDNLAYAHKRCNYAWNKQH
jgi:5-methylcytosine-specific restriction endonuclease McrA